MLGAIDGGGLFACLMGGEEVRHVITGVVLVGGIGGRLGSGVNGIWRERFSAVSLHKAQGILQSVKTA